MAAATNSVAREDAESTVPVTFASDYFKKNGAKPPTVHLIQFSGTFAQLERYILDRINGRTLDISIAKRFIWECMMAKIEGVLSDDWKSFGVDIGKKDEKVTAQALLTLNETDGSVPTLGEAGTGGDWKWMLMVIVAPYRLNTKQKQNNSSGIAGKYDRLIASFRPAGIHTRASTFSKQYYFWARDQNYEMLIAALDMFLFKFGRHEMSRLRIGTINARCKDCAMIVEIGKLMKICSCNCATMLEWIWVPEAEEEYLRMFQSEDELDQCYSYVWYLNSMKLCQRSPYSASLSPNLYLLSNTVRADYPRSRNVKLLSTNSLMDIIENAIVMYYAIFRLQRCFATEEEIQEMQNEENNGGEPIGRSPAKWRNYIEANEGKVPDDIVQYVARQWQFTGEVYEGTICAFLKEHSKVLLKRK